MCFSARSTLFSRKERSFILVQPRRAARGGGRRWAARALFYGLKGYFDNKQITVLDTVVYIADLC